MSQYTRLANSDEQERAIETIEKWLKKLNKSICGYTKIGKYYDTVILDLVFHGNNIYVHVNGFEDTDYGNPGVTVNGVHIKGDWDFETFKEAVEKKEE